jgi:ABC-type proline/glycine betaine transport system substrate-binding protein
MRIYNMLTALAAAAALLACLTSAASARIFSNSETSSTVTFSQVEFGGGFGVVRCNFTLGQRLHSGSRA